MGNILWSALSSNRLLLRTAVPISFNGYFNSSRMFKLSDTCINQTTSAFSRRQFLKTEDHSCIPLTVITVTFLTCARKNLVHPRTHKYHIIIGYRELNFLLTPQEVEHLIRQNTETSISVFDLPLNKACCVLCIIIIICCIHANNKRLVKSPTFLHIKMENSESFTLHLSQLILIIYEEK